jgi:hypothetical protein
VKRLLCRAGATVGVLSVGLSALSSSQGATKEWKDRNTWSNRYEGVQVIRQMGADHVELIGLHAYKEPFTPDSDAVLSVRFDAPAPNNPTIYAREISGPVHYWMETKSRAWDAGATNTFAPWPTADVLRQARIGSDNLAVTVRLSGSSPEVLAPAVIFHRTRPATLTQLEAVFIPGDIIQRGRVTVRRDCPAGAIAFQNVLGRQLGGLPFVALIPVSDALEARFTLLLEDVPAAPELTTVTLSESCVAPLRLGGAASGRP